MLSRRVAAVFFTLVCAFSAPLFVSAVGTEADKLCLDPVPNEQEYRSDKPWAKVFKEVRNGKEIEIFNLYGTNCADKTAGEVTSGHCVAPQRCLATKTDGEKPQTCQQAGSCEGVKPGETTPQPGGADENETPKPDGADGGAPQIPQPSTGGESPQPTKQDPPISDCGDACAPIPDSTADGAATNPLLTDPKSGEDATNNSESLTPSTNSFGETLKDANESKGWFSDWFKQSSSLEPGSGETAPTQGLTDGSLIEQARSETTGFDDASGLNTNTSEQATLGERISETWGNFKEGVSEFASDVKEFASDTYASAKDYFMGSEGALTNDATSNSETPEVTGSANVTDTSVPADTTPSAKPFETYGLENDPIAKIAEQQRTEIAATAEYDPKSPEDVAALKQDQADLQKDFADWKAEAEACKTGCSQERIDEINRDLKDLQDQEKTMNEQIDKYNQLVAKDNLLSGLKQNPDLSNFTGQGPTTDTAQNVLNAERAALTEIAQQRADAFWNQEQLQNNPLVDDANATQSRIANNAFEAANDNVTSQMVREAYSDLTHVQDAYDERAQEAAQTRLDEVKSQLAQTSNEVRVIDPLNGIVEQNPEYAALQREQAALEKQITQADARMDAREQVRDYIASNEKGNLVAETFLNNRSQTIQQALTDSIVKYETENQRLVDFDNGTSVDGRFSRALGDGFAEWSRSAYSDPVNRADSVIAQIVGTQPMTSQVENMLDAYAGNHGPVWGALYDAQTALHDAASLDNLGTNPYYPITGSAAFLGSTVVDPLVTVLGGSPAEHMQMPFNSTAQNLMNYGNGVAFTALNATVIATPFMSPVVSTERALVALEGSSATGELSTLEKTVAARDGYYAAYEQAVASKNISAAEVNMNQYNAANAAVERLGGEVRAPLQVAETSSLAASAAPIGETATAARIESEIATIQASTEQKLSTFTPSETQMAELTRPLTQASAPITTTEQAALERYNAAISEYTRTQQLVADGNISASSPLARDALSNYLDAGTALREAGLMERPGLQADLAPDSVYRAASGEVVASRVNAISYAEPYSVVASPATESAGAIETAVRSSAAPVEQPSIFERVSQPVRDLFGAERPTPNSTFERPAYDTRPQTFTETLERNVYDFLGFTEPKSLGALSVSEARAIDAMNSAFAQRSLPIPSSASPAGALLLETQRGDAVLRAMAGLEAEGLHMRADGPIVRDNGEVVATPMPVQIPGYAPYAVVAPLEQAVRQTAITENATAPSAATAQPAQVFQFPTRQPNTTVQFARAIAAAVPLIVNPVSPVAMFGDVINSLSNAVITQANATPFTNEVARNMVEGVRLVCKATGCDAPTFAKALAGSCAQESGGCDPNMLHDGGRSQYQGLGQLSRTSAMNAAIALQRVSFSPSLTPAEKLDIDGVLQRTREWLSGRSSIDPRFDPHDGSYLFAARQTFMPEMGGTTPLANIQRVAPGNATIQARLIQATQLAPSIHNSGQILNLDAPLTPAQLAAFANNGLGAASTLGEVVGKMGWGSYNANLSRGVAWMETSLLNGDMLLPNGQQTVPATSLASVPAPDTPPAAKDFETRLREAYAKQQSEAAQNKPSLSITAQLEKRLQERAQQDFENAGPAARGAADRTAAPVPTWTPLRFEPVPITASYAATPPRVPINIPYVEQAPLDISDIALVPAKETIVQDIKPAETHAETPAAQPTVVPETRPSIPVVPEYTKLTGDALAAADKKAFESIAQNLKAKGFAVEVLQQAQGKTFYTKVQSYEGQIQPVQYIISHNVGLNINYRTAALNSLYSDFRKGNANAALYGANAFIDNCASGKCAIVLVTPQRVNAVSANPGRLTPAAQSGAVPARNWNSFQFEIAAPNEKSVTQAAAQTAAELSREVAIAFGQPDMPMVSHIEINKDKELTEGKSAVVAYNELKKTAPPTQPVAAANTVEGTTQSLAPTPTVPNAVDVPSPISSDPALLAKRLEETRAAEAKALEQFNKLKADITPVNQKIAEIRKQQNALNQAKTNLSSAKRGLQTLSGLWSQPNPAQLATMTNGTAAAARLSGNVAQLGDTGLASEVRGYVNLLNSMSVPANQTLSNRNLAVSTGERLVARAESLVNNAEKKVAATGNVTELQKTQAALSAELSSAQKTLASLKSVEQTTVAQLNKTPTIAIQETVPATNLASVPESQPIEVPEIEQAPVDLSDIRIQQIETPQFVPSPLSETTLTLPPKFSPEFTMFPYDLIGSPPTYTYRNPAEIKDRLSKALEGVGTDVLPASMTDRLSQLSKDSPTISFTTQEIAAIDWGKMDAYVYEVVKSVINPDPTGQTGYQVPPRQEIVGQTDLASVPERVPVTPGPVTPGPIESIGVNGRRPGTAANDNPTSISRLDAIPQYPPFVATPLPITGNLATLPWESLSWREPVAANSSVPVETPVAPTPVAETPSNIPAEKPIVTETSAPQTSVPAPELSNTATQQPPAIPVETPLTNAGSTQQPPPLPTDSGKTPLSAWENTKLGFKVMRASVLPATGMKNAIALPITGAAAFSIGGPMALTWPVLNVGWRFTFNSAFRNDVIAAFKNGTTPSLAAKPESVPPPLPSPPSPATNAPVSPTTPPAGTAGGGGTPPPMPPDLPTTFASGGTPVPPPGGTSVGKLPWWIIGGTVGGLGTLAYLGGSNPNVDAVEPAVTADVPAPEASTVLPCTARGITRDNMLRMLLGDSLSEVDCVPTPENILNNDPLPTIPDLPPATPPTRPGTGAPGTVPPGATIGSYTPTTGSYIPGSGLGTGVSAPTGFSGASTGGTNSGSSGGIMSAITGFLRGFAGGMLQRLQQPQPIPPITPVTRPYPVTPNPNGTSTPISVQMNATPNPTAADTSVHVSWASVSAVSCRAYDPKGTQITTGSPDSTFVITAPTSSVRYSVSCVGAAGQTATSSVLLIVR